MAEKLAATVGAEQARRGPLRLEFLDGIRGFAALYVVFHHAYLSLGFHGDGLGLNLTWALATNWLAFGNVSVTLFIVLSGFCLMLPLARRRTNYFAEGIGRFAVRRAWRILPPYYGAMALSLLLIAFVPAYGRNAVGLWAESLPAFRPGVLLSHLFLIHNLSLAWISRIDYPMWTVSTEWEIYFVFALLLLPIMRRLGTLAMLVVAISLGVFLDRYSNLAHFDYIGLFALGMAAAKLLYSDSSKVRKVERKVPWGGAALVLAAFFAFLNRHGIAWYEVHSTQSDLLCGAIATCAIIYFAHISMGERTDYVGTRLKILLECRFALALGAISYSLYLVHALVLVAVLQLVGSRFTDPRALLSVVFLIAGPSCLGAAYIAYRLFEKPALELRSRMTAKANTRSSDMKQAAGGLTETQS